MLLNRRQRRENYPRNIINETFTPHTIRYIAYRVFGCLRKFNTFYKHCQIVDPAFNNEKIKTKYNALAQCKLESLSLSIALLYTNRWNTLTMSNL